MGFFDDGTTVDFLPAVQRRKYADVGFAVAIGWQSNGGRILLAGVALETDLVVVGAAFGSFAVAELCFEPGDEFGVAELGVVFADRVANFEDGVL